MLGGHNMKEIWKDIKDYEHKYQVSNLGNVRSLSRIDSRGYNKTGKMLKGRNDGRGYLKVALYTDGKPKNLRIHRLVVMAFLGDIKEGYEVNHIDLNKQNNKLNNLELLTPTENMKHSHKNQDIKYNANSLSDWDVVCIRSFWKHKPSCYTMQMVADYYNVSKRYIESIVQNRRRKHLKALEG